LANNGQDQHAALLRQWYLNFSLLAQRHTALTPAESIGAKLLQLHAVAISIISSTGTTTAQTAVNPTNIQTFDSHTPSFVIIVDIAEWLIERHELPVFSFDLGVIAPLYYTALRCRDQAVRRKAIALLRRSASLREGIWSSAMAANMAQRFVDVEMDVERLANQRNDAEAIVEGVDGKSEGRGGTISSDTNGSGLLRIRFSKPNAYERAIRMHIGKNGEKVGSREEVVTW
jgi:hypothetical protein